MNSGIKSKLKDAVQSLYERIGKSPSIGIIFAISSSICFPFNYFSAQEVLRHQRDIPLFEVILLRNFFPLILLTLYIMITKKTITFSRDKWGSIIQVILIAYLSSILGYIALLFISSALMLPISATSPLFAILFSVYILKDKFFWLDAICGVVALIGVLLIYRPKVIFGMHGMENHIPRKNMIFKNCELNSLIGCVLAISFGALKALSITLVKRWSIIAKEFTALIFYQNLVGTLITPIIMILSGKTFVLPKTPYITCCLLSTSVFTLLGLLTSILAMKTQSPTVVSLIRNLDIIWGFLLQFAFLRIWPSLWSIGGSTLIIITTIIVCFRRKILEIIGKSTEEKEGEVNLKLNNDDDNDD